MRHVAGLEANSGPHDDFGSVCVYEVLTCNTRETKLTARAVT